MRRTPGPQFIVAVLMASLLACRLGQAAGQNAANGAPGSVGMSMMVDVDLVMEGEDADRDDEKFDEWKGEALRGICEEIEAFRKDEKNKLTFLPCQCRALQPGEKQAQAQKVLLKITLRVDSIEPMDRNRPARPEKFREDRELVKRERYTWLMNVACECDFRSTEAHKSEGIAREKIIRGPVDWRKERAKRALEEFRNGFIETSQLGDILKLGVPLCPATVLANPDRPEEMLPQVQLAPLGFVHTDQEKLKQSGIPKKPSFEIFVREVNGGYYDRILSSGTTSSHTYQGSKVYVVWHRKLTTPKSRDLLVLYDPKDPLHPATMKTNAGKGRVAFAVLSNQEVDSPDEPLNSTRYQNKQNN
jgi:hypothetical protein